MEESPPKRSRSAIVHKVGKQQYQYALSSSCVQAADFLADTHTLTQLCSLAAHRLFHAYDRNTLYSSFRKRKHSQLSDASSVVLCQELVQVRGR